MSARRRRAAPAWAAGALVVTWLVASCSEAAGPGGVLSVAFDKAPMPALVLNDSLRDTLGVARPLKAHAFGASAEIVGAPIRYLSLDTGIVVDSIGGWVVATNRRATVARVVATVAGLQTQAESLFVALSPDTASIVGTAPTIIYVTLPRTAVQNTSAALSVRVGHTPAAPGPPADSVSGNWLVRYTLVRSATVAADSTFLAGATAGSSSAFAVADLSGVASKTVRVVPKFGQRLKDTVIVDASVTWKGVAVRGSPVRFIVPLTPADSIP